MDRELGRSERGGAEKNRTSRERIKNRNETIQVAALQVLLYVENSYAFHSIPLKYAFLECRFITLHMSETQSDTGA